MEQNLIPTETRESQNGLDWKGLSKSLSFHTSAMDKDTQILMEMIHDLQDEALADHPTPDNSMEWCPQLIPLSLHDSLSDLKFWI